MNSFEPLVASQELTMPDERIRRRRDDDYDDRPRRRRSNDDDEFDDDRPRRRRRDEEEGDVTGGIIPYKNPAALASYYCGVFSLIPGLGCALSPIAVILGIIGLMNASAHPKARGRAHAVTGIIFGLLLAPALWAGIYFLFRWASKN
jgi:hypothetical protein